MTIDERLKSTIGELVFQNAGLAAKVDEQTSTIEQLNAKIQELEKQAENLVN